MGLLWRQNWGRVRDASCDQLLSSFDLWYSASSKTAACNQVVIRIFAQSIQITGQLFPRKPEPKISSCSTVPEREREKRGTAREKWLAEILVYPTSLYTLCCQCLTGSWLSRPRCFYLLTSMIAHAQHLSLYMRSSMPFLFCLHVSLSLVFFLCQHPPWSVTLPARKVSVLSHWRNKAVMASHLLQYLG